MKMRTKDIKKEVPLELRLISSQIAFRRIKLKDIAGRLKVDPSAISHVLNGTAKSEYILAELKKMVNV